MKVISIPLWELPTSEGQACIVSQQQLRFLMLSNGSSASLCSRDCIFSYKEQLRWPSMDLPLCHQLSALIFLVLTDLTFHHFLCSFPTWHNYEVQIYTSLDTIHPFLYVMQRLLLSVPNCQVMCSRTISPFLPDISHGTSSRWSAHLAFFNSTRKNTSHLCRLSQWGSSVQLQLVTLATQS